MSAVVDVRSNTIRQLDGRAQPEEQVRESDVQDASKLARLLTRILAELAAARRRFAPRRVTFANQAVVNDGTTLYRFPHRFGSTVSWSVAGWRGAVGGSSLAEDPSTDANTLVLVSFEAGTLDLLIEERG